MAFQTVVEIDFPSGTRRYSVRGILHPSAFYKNTMVEAGVLQRGIPALPGRYRSSQIALRFWNRSKEFSALKASNAFYNAAVRVYRSETGGALIPIAQGFIADWALHDNVFALSADDPIAVKLDFPIDHGALINLEKSIFPDLPASQEPLLVPLPYGELELSAPAIAQGLGPGTVPCYLIDPKSTGSVYRYVVAQCAVHSIKRVFNYETLVSASNYTVTTTNLYNGQTMTFLDFTADQRNAQRARDLEITCDLWGIVDSAGALIDNPAQQVSHFLSTYGPSVNVNTSAAQTTATMQNYKSAFALLDNRWTYQDVLDRFSESFLMPIYPTRAGVITAVIVTEALPSTTTSISETMDILKGTFSILANKELATRIRYSSEYHWARGFFQRQRSVFILGEQARIGKEVVKDIKLWFVRDGATAQKVARAHGPALRELANYVEFEVEPGRLTDLDLNAGFGLTHQDGIAVSGGYSNKPARIIQSDYYPAPSGAKCFVRALVPPAIDYSTQGFQKNSFWANAKPEQEVEISQLLNPTSYPVNDMYWGLHVGGDEYIGGRGSLLRGPY